MVPRDITSVALTIFGLWLVVQNVLALGNFAPVLINPEVHRASASPWPYLVTPVLSIAVGVLLLVYRGRIASVLTSTSQHGESAGVAPLESIAFASLGLYLAIMALVRYVQWESQNALILSLAFPEESLRELGGDMLESSQLAWSYRASYLTQFGLGIFLFLRPGGIVKLWNWAREAGRPAA